MHSNWSACSILKNGFEVETNTQTTIAPWLHEEAGIASDPINLLFEVGSASNPISYVVVALETAGWNATDFGDPQYIYYNDTRIREDAQFEKHPSWFPSVPGIGNILFRYHLRLWHEPSLDSRVLGSVHLEIFSNGHEVISFDEAKRVIAADFLSGGWVVQHDAAPLDNSWIDSRNLSLSGKFLTAVGRRDGGALSRLKTLQDSARDRVLSNGHATLITRQDSDAEAPPLTRSRRSTRRIRFED